jgi:hypothetical protein
MIAGGKNYPEQRRTCQPNVEIERAAGRLETYSAATEFIRAATRAAPNRAVLSFMIT